jgi:acetoin utilization deacetylase AcuC-like enzyme
MKHLLDGHGKLAYALVRPPGHHAQPSQADGYCFLNNAGLAVQLALDSGCKKVAVIDIDVHYGNGTAEGFYSSNKVLTISLHMNHGSWGPSHPQNGSIDELGEGEGYGYNLNIPLPNGTGDKGYAYAFNELVVPSIHKFEPDMIVLVIGQDSSAVSYSIYLFLLSFIHNLIVVSILLSSFCRHGFVLSYRNQNLTRYLHDFYGMNFGPALVDLFELVY